MNRGNLPPSSRRKSVYRSLFRRHTPPGCVTQRAGELALYEGGNVLKRLLLAITAAALIAMLTATAAQAQGYWYWCWDDSSGSWAYCWWDSGGIGQESDQESSAGEITQTVSVT
jgi:hypothetical protein